MRGACSWDTCGRPHHAKGLCKVHYTKQFRQHKRNRKTALERRIENVEVVLNTPLRERYLELRAKDERITSTVCAFMASQGFPYMRGKHSKRRDQHDGTRLRRTLGLAATSADKRSGNPGLLKQYVRYDEAVALSRALGMAPFEAGV